MSIFAEEHKLSYDGLTKLARGQFASYQGWMNEDMEKRQVGVSKLTKEQKEECVVRYNSGESSTSIARDLGVSPNSIISILTRRGVQMRKNTGRRKKEIG